MGDALFFMAPRIDIQRSEETNDWPRDACLVCLREHGKTVPAANREEAIEHRKREHRWFHDILMAEPPSRA